MVDGPSQAAVRQASKQQPWKGSPDPGWPPAAATMPSSPRNHSASHLPSSHPPRAAHRLDCGNRSQESQKTQIHHNNTHNHRYAIDTTLCFASGLVQAPNLVLARLGSARVWLCLAHSGQQQKKATASQPIGGGGQITPYFRRCLLCLLVELGSEGAGIVKGRLLYGVGGTQYTVRSPQYCSPQAALAMQNPFPLVHTLKIKYNIINHQLKGTHSIDWLKAFPSPVSRAVVLYYSSSSIR